MKIRSALITICAVASALTAFAVSSVPVNPILPGFHADPETLYSQKTGKYYIYSTTDGTPGWGGTAFSVFSSDNLADWTDEGIVLDLATDQVSWAEGNAWAPAIIERKIGDDYKYFLYFSGRPVGDGPKQIGVAISDMPTGPFVDLGHPIITKSPAGRGQQIDVDVFVDPVTDTPYIYWGNGYMAGAQLEPDMVTVIPETVTVMTPSGGTKADYQYREAPYVFFRDGKYYFMWSVDDTGSPNYHVAYGTSDSPLGPIKVADNTVILSQRAEYEIYGTAHNSVVNVPGTDEWYIVYHRINPKYLHDGPGIHREVCIDRMTFDPDGTIRVVRPSKDKMAEPFESRFRAGKGTFTLDGKPFIVKAAEVHYPRIPREYWEHRIQMCKALGMNTLCLYVFWNIHEQREDEFDFTGNNDIAEFCRLAQKHGMWVIVRPGPYVCAEWEMGGLPWWLLKKTDIRLREQDPYFMERVRKFEHEVGKQLSPLTIDNGGPIIMVQVENEYGSYGKDKPYVAEIAEIVRDSGFDQVTLFQCDWSSNFTNNGLQDLIWTMNFGTGANIDEQFARLKDLRPDSPLMCSEFWSGWFDKWGANHETRKADDMVAGIDEMLSKGISFSLYMTHGGTSFGHWAGANSPGFAPDVTSYDYDAPITEWGTATPKYYLLRDVLARYSDTKLPPVPKPKPIMTIPQFSLTEYAPLEAGIVRMEQQRNVAPMEMFDQGWGSISYTTLLPAIPVKSMLNIAEPHDYVQVFINGNHVGTVDRVRHQKQLPLPEVNAGDTLTLLVEGMGRINFGRAIKDYKGITDKVTITAQDSGHDLTYDLKNWDIALMPDDYATVSKAFEAADKSSAYGQRGYYRGYFNVNKAADTFLDFSTWGKGQVWVNGHALGRIWAIGPQQTLYMPGCWLRKGSNEIIVLDVAGPKEAVCQGLAAPKLDELHVEKSNLHNDPARLPDLSSTPVAATAQLKAGNGWQTIKFDTPRKGKYLIIEIESTHDGDNVTAIAELYALGDNGQRLSRESWTARYADSENEAEGNHTLDKVYDLQESTYWSTVPGMPLPHTIVIRMGDEPQQITGVDYLPRAEQGAPGSVRSLKVYVR